MSMVLRNNRRLSTSLLGRFQLALVLGFLCMPEIALLSFFSAGALLAAPAGAPRHVDAVVVLGGDWAAGGVTGRYRRGRDLVLAGYSRRLILIYPGTADVADAKARLSSVEVLDATPMRGSWGEAVAVRRYMQAQGLRSVLVVSDPPHMLRLLYTWTANFRGTGLEFRLVATNPTWWSGWRWWREPQAARFVGNEVNKLAGYLAKYRFGL